MDVVRQKPKSRKWLRWILLLLLICGGITGAAKLSSFEAALPEFDRSSVILDTVQKGTLVREVRGTGVLQPEDITFVSTEIGGTIVEVPVEPGSEVTPETVLLELHDPQMERAIRDAERILTSAKAEVERYKLQQRAQHLDMKVATARARATYEDSQSQAELNETLARRELISRRQYEQSRDRAERNRMLLEVELERARNNKATQEIQLGEKQAAVARATDRLAEQKERREALIVRAGVHGILQQLGSSNGTLEVGQRIGLGSLVAKISNPKNLMAVLRISQTQAREVVEGQRVKIDIRSAIIDGQVTRVDPVVQNERVAVDVRLIGEMPPGARPELSVDGLVEVARMEDVYHVRKPIYGRDNGQMEVFRLQPDGRTLVRTMVEFGAASVHTIEVMAGLQEGDQIVVSDTTKWRTYDRVQIR